MSENARRENRIQGIVDRISSEDDFDSIKWITQAPVQTFCRSAVDETAQKNAELQRDLGIQAKIVRTMTGKENCKWCEGLAGEYEYPDVPDDVYRRHDDCDCVVEYQPGDGSVQDVWSKEWKESAEDIEARKTANIETPSDADIAKDIIKETTERNENEALNEINEILEEKQKDIGADNVIPYSENEFVSGIKAVDYSMLPTETQKAFNNALSKLNDKFRSTLDKITHTDKDESLLNNIFARTSTDARLDRSTIFYNPLKIKNIERIKELKAKGYIPKNIPDDQLVEYVITHELGHTIFTPGAWTRVKSVFNQNLKPIRQAKKEVDEIFDRYTKTIGQKEATKRELTNKILLEDLSEKEFQSIRKQVVQVEKEIDALKISEYSLTNADEMVAEAYAEYMLGTSNSPATEEIIAVLEKYFGK